MLLSSFYQKDFTGLLKGLHIQTGYAKRRSIMIKDRLLFTTGILEVELNTSIIPPTLPKKVEVKYVLQNSYSSVNIG